MNDTLLQWAGCCLALMLLAGGCANKEQGEQSVSVTDKVTSSSSTTTNYKGKVASFSKRAQAIFLTVGSGANAQTVRVKFDDATKGVDEIAEGHFVTIDYELRDGEAYATSVQQNKATLPEGVTNIDTDELLRLIRERASFVLVDPRPMDRYKQSHLPGAVSISIDLSEQQQTELLPQDKNTLLVFYDGGHGRGTAITSAAAAKNKGFANVRVYTTGRAAWMDASLPTYSTREYIQSGNVLVIDTRPKKTSAVGRIKGAYTLSVDTINATLRDLPRDAPIVLYGDEATKALELLTDEGFTAVTLLDGGYASWVEAGSKIEKGPISTAKIKWERKLETGEVSLDDFRKAVSGKEKDILLIDVRGRDEIGKQPLITNAINIPLDELPAQEATLPKDKMMYLYCSTGARAKMAYNELANAGFKAKFLRMNIKDLSAR
ncbi:Rhodanese domain protein [Desulfobulbus propionicus DSM 2032]|uniref:Rhodanese domain protein n=1 Tax=Desulfobulbus propionicus (strain ATCC 33891 / DSM 2032 / VKM B-1956 / 1pr3) TaxID=577650 RepID=A0A7U4DNV8_DESPD|nr:rhodanese-like domain-containing protein [Desulfobulbus propionicus]ADW17422.1 Rhodanese domain protein [Desulfobulbus propionicus DSM 2032]